jgi:transcriptional regulator with XRE-family HTH domain
VADPAHEAFWLRLAEDWMNIAVESKKQKSRTAQIAGAQMSTRVNPIDKHVGSRARMRRLMLNMSQTQIAEALGLTFQQVQKYEKGTNRISASRLQQLCRILQVPIAFFFEGAPRALGLPEPTEADAESPSYVSDFLATTDGLTLVKAFTRIRDAKLRRAIVALVQEVASEADIAA